MQVYARVLGGVVVEIINPIVYDVDSPPGCEHVFKKGDEVPIDRRYHADVAQQCVDITGVVPSPAVGWLYDGKKFSPPQS